MGPTADYVGIGLQNWAEKRVKNASRIFEKAAQKLGPKIDEPGAVPPRILKDVLQEGSYCDDELTAEYFGGVLASSRSEVPRDDRAATYLKLTSELSTYQIRFHYICYATWRKMFTGSGLRPTFGVDLDKMWIFLPASFLLRAMEFTNAEPAPDILIHCMSGLERHETLRFSHWGSVEHVNPLNAARGWCEVNEYGLCVAPTQFGIDYWLWAIGVGQTSITKFLQDDLTLPRLPEIELSDGPIKLISGEQ
ncbi:MAG TPA: hypothetical protein VHS05_09455 [Pyrinomonadaceae bacterium]|nr:hypothetical protein [Pyrinomonadaceae bacterium]